MNGPVFVAAVIEREGWSADISFVGHANTIQVAVRHLCLLANLLLTVCDVFRRSIHDCSSEMENRPEERRPHVCWLLVRMTSAFRSGATLGINPSSCFMISSTVPYSTYAGQYPHTCSKQL